MNDTLSCFKAYDVRGELGVNFDGDICYRIGRAFAQFLQALRLFPAIRLFRSLE